MLFDTTNHDADRGNRLVSVRDSTRQVPWVLPFYDAV
jgi:hypothetical protein